MDKEKTYRNLYTPCPLPHELKATTVEIAGAKVLEFEFKEDAIKEYNKLSKSKTNLLSSITHHKMTGWSFDCMVISEDYANRLIEERANPKVKKYTRYK